MKHVPTGRAVASGLPGRQRERRRPGRYMDRPVTAELV